MYLNEYNAGCWTSKQPITIVQTALGRFTMLNLADTEISTSMSMRRTSRGDDLAPAMYIMILAVFCFFSISTHDHTESRVAFPPQFQLRLCVQEAIAPRRLGCAWSGAIVTRCSGLPPSSSWQFCRSNLNFPLPWMRT